MEPHCSQFLVALGSQRGYSDNTTAAYRNDLSQFARFIAGHFDGLAEPERVTGEMIAAYIAELNNIRYATSTIARKIAAVKSFFHYLRQIGAIADDPTGAISSPKVKKHPPQVLDPAAAERLVKMPAGSASPKALRDRALLELLYATGIRVSEAVNLRVEDVDLDRRVVQCRGRGESQRTLPMNVAAAAVSEYLHKGRPELAKPASSSTLFLNHRGQGLTRQGLWLIIKAYAREAGVGSRVTPHTLRHSFARQQVNSGTELRQVQALLGHASISTTQVYTQVAEEPEKVATSG